MDKAGAVLEKLERRREVSARKGGVVKGRSVSFSLPSSSTVRVRVKERGVRGKANDWDRQIGII